MKKINKTEELLDVSPSIVQMERSNIYTVSSSYFESLPAEIIKKIRLEQEPVYRFSPATPYRVPDNYFDNLPHSVLKRVKSKTHYNSEVEEEIDQVAPLLNLVSKEPVYKVPAGYFESVQIRAKESKKTERKLVSFRTTKKIFKFLAAAIITGILAVGAFRLTEKDSTGQKTVNTNTEVKNLTEDEIIEYLKTNSIDDISPTLQKIKENDVKSSLSEMSDSEIRQYLKENGEPDGI